MSARHRNRDRHVEHPDVQDRTRSRRSLRRSTRNALHVSRTTDPELDHTVLPEPRNDTQHVVVEPTVGRRTRLRHWKTREWKRRSTERRRRAASSRGDADLGPSQDL